MGELTSGTLFLYGVIALIVLTHQTVRAAAVWGCVVLLLYAAGGLFLHTRTCPGGESMCPLQPVGSGLCTSSSGASIVKAEGEYYLSVDSPGARAYCFDVRVWL